MKPLAGFFLSGTEAVGIFDAFEVNPILHSIDIIVRGPSGLTMIGGMRADVFMDPPINAISGTEILCYFPAMSVSTILASGESYSVGPVVVHELTVAIGATADLVPFVEGLFLAIAEIEAPADLVGGISGEWRPDAIINGPADLVPFATADMGVLVPLDAESDLLSGALADYLIEALMDAQGALIPSVLVSVMPGKIPYELMTHAVAQQTGSYLYTLKATGSGNYLRRAVFGAPSPGEGVNHPVNARFAAIGPGMPGILKKRLDPNWIGKTLKVKICAFNKFGKGLQDLADVVEYEFQPTGVGLLSAYTQSPSVVLSQDVSTYEIDAAQATVQFSRGGSAIYNARTFSISDPGGSPVVYYVTVFDPNQHGDNPGETNLTAYCEASKGRLGVAGFVYLGSIEATHDGGVTGTPGGSLAADLELMA